MIVDSHGMIGDDSEQIFILVLDRSPMLFAPRKGSFGEDGAINSSRDVPGGGRQNPQDYRHKVVARSWCVRTACFCREHVCIYIYICYHMLLVCK